MATVSLALFKTQVRADDYDDDDDYLAYLLDVSEQAVVNATNRTYDELLSMGGGEMPKPIQQAILLLGAHYYSQRESVAGVQMHAVPDSLQTLIKQYQKLADDV